jgi:hypothetical protein
MMYQLSLVSGWLPPLITTTGFLALAWVLLHWPRRVWWSLPIVFAGAVAVLVGVSFWWQLPQKLHGTWPRSFFMWAAFPVVAVVAAVVTWRRGRLGHHLVSMVAVILLTACAADRVDIYYGAFPTIGDALGAPLPGELAQPFSMHQLVTRTGLPQTGVVFPLRIAGTVSHFAARSAYVWLPPIWFAHPRPRLPALELVGGSPSFGATWFYGGEGVRTLDAYANTHQGRGPIVVVADQNGSILGDTECVDGPQGRADTYISVDVVRTIDRLFSVRPGPRAWTIAGYSAGGTCALITAVRHPNTYGAFGDFSGDQRPNNGPWNTTLANLFGGSITLARTYDPARLLHTHRYPRLLAWFEIGRQDAAYRRTGMQQLAALARRSGAHVIFITPSGSHTFYFWQHCLQTALPSFIHATSPTTRRSRGHSDSHLLLAEAHIATEPPNQWQRV